ncbi:hypothetical protein HF324_18550 [Chitinophaga oryzae]|uniref:Uncharacterized protein n=1 Tax=Chitinophaga oryzae TaxID=2725414 RepID=A0ABX6LI37_9BACT|nr:hypothetical protein [Chitinophaga oryzae]QJB39750.1 hypothetical protein HF324_18550 [Chitinophaga oryzae]
MAKTNRNNTSSGTQPAAVVAITGGVKDVAVAQVSPFPTVDINKGFPDLVTARAMPFDLMADYWTPEEEGEEKRIVFYCLKTRPVQDMNDTTIIMDLLCAFFWEKTAGGIRSISNGSKRLVGALKENNVQSGTPLLVTYLGKKKNKNNNYQSDLWSVKPLLIKV